MLGLLRFVVFSIVAVGVLVLLGVELLLPPLVSAAIRQSPVFAGQPVAVQVRTSLTGVLLHGWIDEVSVTGASLREGSVTASGLEVRLTDFTIIGRTFSSIAGSLTGVVLTTADGSTLGLDNVTVSGSSSAITAVGAMAPSTLEAALANALRPLGVAPGQLHLGDGAIRIDLAGRSLDAHLRLEGSTLVLDTGTELGAVRILEPPADGAWTLSMIQVSPAGVQVTAVIRASAILSGG